MSIEGTPTSDLPITEQVKAANGVFLPAPVEAMTVLEHSVCADWTEFLDRQLGHRQDNGFVGRLPLLTFELWESTPYKPHSTYLLNPEHVQLFFAFVKQREGYLRQVSDDYAVKEALRLVNAFDPDNRMVTYACFCFTVVTI